MGVLLKLQFLFILCWLLKVNIVCAQTKVVSFDNSPIEISITNYNSISEIKKFEKLELGLLLPENLSKKIKSFVEATPGQKINPFLEWEIKVEAEFTHSKINSPIRIDGFYFQSFDGWMKHPLPKPNNGKGYNDEEYASVGKYQKKYEPFPFRVRFTPPMTGDWNCIVRVEIPGQTIESIAFNFSVLESEAPGYVSVAENKRFLELNNHTFIPIGCNMPWPITRSEFDPEFAKKNIAIWSDKEEVIEEQYRPNVVAPRVHQSYRNVINNFADNGSNCFRMIMYPSGTEIEWEELGNYTKRLPQALELDSILMTAEDRNMYIQWVMQSHYSFQKSVHAYATRWAWDSDVNGANFCYSKIPGISKEIDFFTNETAKKYYKQRLRYILARWGYSTHVSVFEIFSEISNVGTPEADNSSFYYQDENWKLSRDWQWEMAEYIKSKYQGKMHLLTASYAGPVDVDDDVYKSSFFDVMGSNVYDYGPPSFSHRFWNAHLAGSYLNETCQSSAAYGFECKDGVPEQYTKPLMFGESGLANIGGACGTNVVELNRHLWQELFSGLAGSFTWDSWYYTGNYEIFGQLNRFISQFDLDAGKWHPGASKIKDYDSIRSWVYTKKYASGMDATFTPKIIFPWKKRDRKADICYLRSGDKQSAIGVITNKTYNIGNTDNCIEWEGFIGSPIEFQEKISCKREKLKLKGLKSGSYTIQYYLPNDIVDPITTSRDVGPNVKIEYEIDASEKGYIVLFVATKKN